MITAVVDMREKSSYSDLELPGGGSAFDRALSSLESVSDRIVVLSRPGDTSAQRTLERRVPVSQKFCEVDVLPVLAALEEIADGATALIYARGDEPFIQADLASDLLDTHTRYAAHYTFADGYPAGMSVEILAPALPGLLRNLAGKEDKPENLEGLSPGWLFNLLQKDINAFDVETMLAPRDMRMLRIELRCNRRSNFVLCRRVAERGVSGHRELSEYLDTNREVLRTIPEYFPVQISALRSQNPVYSGKTSGGDSRRGMDAGRRPAESDQGTHAQPHSEFSDTRFLTAARAEALFARIAEMNPEAVIGLGIWGEPLLNPELEAILERVWKHNSLSVVVETAAVDLEAEAIARVVSRFRERVRWIITLDANDPEIYRRIRGDGFERAWKSAHTLVERAPEAVWVQAVRMDMNEAHLEHFYRYWKERTANVIIQKYDWLSGRLPQRKVTDLSPLTRLPCWQNKRELSLLLDGSVPRCREDIDATYPLGNADNDSLETIWERGDALHRQHIAGTYPEICEHCDEYYVFTF